MIGNNQPPVSPVPPSNQTPAKAKVGKNVAVVSATVLIIILIILIALAFAVAKSGIVKIPLLSKLYNGPTPAHVVITPPLTTDVVQQRIVSRLSDSIYTGVPPYKFTITEEELTAALQDTIQAAFRDDKWDIKTLQIAVLPSDLELTAELKRGIFQFDFQARFIPVVSEGGLQIELIEMHFGDYPVHPELGMKLAGAIFSRDFGTWTFRLGAITFDKVVLQEGVIEATVLVSE